jgi:hypothetical protein
MNVETPLKIKEPGFFANFDTTVVTLVLFVIGFVITLTSIGPYEALRSFAAEALVLGATFIVARQYLPWEDAPKERVKRPKIELIVALVAYALLIIWAATSNGLISIELPPLAMRLWPLLALLVPVVVLAAWRYSRAGWGLRWPTSRELVVLVVIVAVNIGLSQLLGRLLPPRELTGAQTQKLLAPLMNGEWLVAVRVVVSAVLAELFFRVFLQTRLAAFQQGRWALFVQAVLYSAIFFPYLLSAGYPMPYAVAMGMVLSNGIMAGYFWRKTGSWPLLILLNLFFFSRWGL